MQRLHDGQPTRSTGALTTLQLAAEAGVKRWVLTHKHTDFKDEFAQLRTQANGIPHAFQHLQARNIDLEAADTRLHEANAELAKRVNIYAQVIHELRTALDRHAEQARDTGNLHALPRATR